MESSKFDKIVQQLKYSHGDTSLNDKIKDALGNDYSANSHFNIKHQIAQLNKVCLRPLDFRLHKDIGVADYVINGTSHFIDPRTKAFFEQELGKYNNRYTQGVYDAVIDFFEQNKHAFAEFHAGFSEPLELIRFGTIQTSAEECMNFAVQVTMTPLAQTAFSADFVPNVPPQPKECIGITKGISHTTLKVRHKSQLQNGELIAVHFDGLSKDIAFKHHYVTFMKDDNGDDLEPGVSSLKLIDIDANAEFRQYAANLIANNKSRYKVDVTPVVESILIKSHEQLFLPHARHMMFIVDDRGKVHWAMCPPNEAHHLAYFDEENGSVLDALLEKDEVLTTLGDNGTGYYFVNKGTLKGERVYLSCLVEKGDQELALAQQFIAEQSAKLFKVSLRAVDPVLAFQKTAVPEEAQDHFGSARIHRYSPRLQQQFAQMRWVLTMTPISPAALAIIIESQRTYQTQQRHLMPTRGKHFNPIATIDVHLPDSRQEDRFLLTSKIALTYDNITLSATLIDVSSLGLRCRFESPHDIPTGTVIKVTFGDLIKKNKQYNLTQCRYTVISCEGIELRASNARFTGHEGRKFWQVALNTNLDNLSVTGRKETHYGLHRVMGNLACAHNDHILAFFRDQKGAPMLHGLAVSHDQCLGERPWDQREQIINNAKLWFYSRECVDFVKSFLVDKREAEAFMVLSLDSDQQNSLVRKANVVPLEGANPQLIANLLRVARLNQRAAQLYLVSITETGSEVSRFYRDELNYVQRYAPHRHDELQKVISGTVGMLSLLDITELRELFTAEEETVMI